MTAIQTTVHVGPDGILRFEVPVEQRDRDLNVIVVVETPEIAATSAGQLASDMRGRLEAAGIRVPSSAKWNDHPVKPIHLSDSGPSASEFLINERR